MFITNICLHLRINPVVGCVQKDKPNPLAGMTEEQKEYEANRLVNAIDQLQRLDFLYFKIIF